MAKKRKKTKLNKFFRVLIGIGLIVFLVIQFAPNVIKGNVATKLPNQSEYLDKVDTKGFLIMHETVYTSEGEGVLELNASEGQRVPKDFEVANLNLTNDVSDAKDELLKVQSAIEYKNQSLNPEDIDYETTDAEINIIHSIQDYIIVDDMQSLFASIDNLELNTRKNINISDIGELINLSLQELEHKKDSLSREISINNIPYKAEISGVVSYKIDYLEEVLNFENMGELNYEQLKSLEIEELAKPNNLVSQGDPVYKLIDNYEYYMALLVEDSTKINDYKIGDSIEVIADGSISLKGVVYDQKTTDNSAVLIVKFNDKLQDLNYNRIHDVNIIKSKNYVYVVPSQAIAILENREGVYIKELNGIVRFRPIKILYQNELETFVDIGDNKGYIEVEDNVDLVKTITLFDEVILNPQNIEDGQILK